MSRTTVLALLAVLPISVFSGPGVVRAQLHCLWSDTITATDTSFAPSFMRVGQNGRIYVSGIATSLQGNKSLMLECFDSGGTYLWRSLFDCGPDPICNITELAIGGTQNSFLTATTGWLYPGKEALTLSFDAAGSLMWARRDSALCDYCTINSIGIALDRASQVYIAEDRCCDTVLPFGYLVVTKLQKDGSVTWQDEWGNPIGDDETGRYVYLDTFGHLYVTGHAPIYHTPHTYGVAWTISFDTSGALQWYDFYGNEGDIRQDGYSCVSDSAGNAYVIAGPYPVSGGISYFQTPTVIGYDSSGTLLGYCRIDEAGNAWVVAGNITVAEHHGFIVSALTTMYNRSTLCSTALIDFDLTTRWVLIDSCGGDSVVFGHQGVRFDGVRAIYRWAAGEIKGIDLAGHVEWETTPGYLTRDLLVTGNGEFVACGLATIAGRDAIVVSKYRACACPCLGDPACDGVRVDVLDVVTTIGVAFRGSAATGDAFCPYKSTDVDCSGATDVVDVVKVIDVAFRGGDPQSLLCYTCLP